MFQVTIVDVAQLAVLALGFWLGLRQLKSLKHDRGFRAIQEVEVQLDPLFIQMGGEGPAVITRILNNHSIEDLDADEKSAYAYVYFAYRHASRYYYLLTSSTLDLGMSQKEKSYIADLTINSLAKYDQRLLLRVHDNAKKAKEFNERFLQRVDRFLERKALQDQK